MFRRISFLLALQFTTFVSLLLLISGSIFIVTDYRFSRRMSDDQLARQTNAILDHLPLMLEDVSTVLQPPLRDRVRVLDAAGRPIYTGNLLRDVPFQPSEAEYSDVGTQGEQLHIMTTPIVEAGMLVGFLQIGNNPPHINDLPVRAFIFLVISALISILTFFVGLFFAKRSLKPAEETMQRLEQFTQDASHELRTPLATLGSSLDLSLKTKNYREGIVSAKEDLQRIAMLIERLLELARLDKLALVEEQADLGELVQRTIADHAHLAREKGINMEQTLGKKVLVTGDQMLLLQLFGNLLSNAIKYTPGGGTIRLQLDKRSLTISDTGVGIPAAALPSIFNRFYQVDASRSHGGFGLGLALAKRIVDLHGWTIAAASEEGKSSTFTIGFHAKESPKRTS